MEAMELLPIILYILLIILVVVAIVFLVRLIQIVGKVDKVVDEVDLKVKKLNGLFNIVDRTTDTLNIISDKVITGIVNSINAIFKKRKRKGEDFDE